MADAAAAAPDAPHHPTAGTFLIAFKAAAIAYYVLCGWLPIPFTVNFCVVAFLLVLDFWTVRRAEEACCGGAAGARACS